MGYFNYFVKCVIRNFVNLFFKHKIMFSILVAIFVLYLFCGSARAEAWTANDIANLENTLSRLRTVLIEQLNELEQIKNNTQEVEDQIALVNERLLLVNSYLAAIRDNTNDLKSQLSTIVSELTTINADILNIYNKLDENQKKLLSELDEDNKAILEELNMIRDSINGTEQEKDTYVDLGLVETNPVTPDMRLKGISLNYEPKYTYTIKLYYSNPWTNYQPVFVADMFNKFPNPYVEENYKQEFELIGYVPPNTSNYVIVYEVPASNPDYLYFNMGGLIKKIEVYRSIKGIAESLNQSNSLQQQQNQLQNQQNQLQQEQNNFMQQETQDSSVDIGGFNNVDSNDITSSGLTGIFNNIYNSISSWNSKDIKLPIPYTNTSITIPANYTYNMLSSAGGGWIINFISVVYYFIVGRFLVYSITNIINSIKSGKILETDNKNNITTDML